MGCWTQFEKEKDFVKYFILNVILAGRSSIFILAKNAEKNH